MLTPAYTTQARQATRALQPGRSQPCHPTPHAVRAKKFGDGKVSELLCGAVALGVCQGYRSQRALKAVLQEAPELVRLKPERGKVLENHEAFPPPPKARQSQNLLEENPFGGLVCGMRGPSVSTNPVPFFLLFFLPRFSFLSV